MKYIKNVLAQSILVETEDFGRMIITPSIYIDNKQLIVSLEEFNKILKQLGLIQEEED